jgi:hypothetical protein
MEILPIKLIPSAAGSSMFLQRGKRLDRINLAGGSEGLGIMLNDYNTRTLEQLVHRGYVSRLELESADFLQFRGEVQDISRAVGVAALEAAFARDMTREIDRYQAGRRGTKYEKLEPDQRTATMRSLLAGLRGNRKGTIEGGAALLKSLSAETIDIAGAMIRGGLGEELSTFRDLLTRYALRWEVPEFFALVILEIVNSLQVQTMQNFATRAGMSEEKIRTLYQQDSVRKMIREKMEAHGESSAITWSFLSTSDSSGGARSTQMLVTMTGRGAEMLSLKDDVEEKRQIQVGSKSLQDFYAENKDSVFNIDLGLYYLSYLQDLCKRSNMLFDARVQHMNRGDYTIIQLKLHL